MNNDVIDEFLAYVDRYEPDFRARVAGAPESDIDVLQSACGYELPAVYRSYLRQMGAKDGGLNIGQGATTRAGAVIRYYEELRADNDSPPPGCIVIAVNGVGVEETSLQIIESGEPRVVNTSGAKIQDLYAETLQGLLFRFAFIKYRMRNLKYSHIYEAPLGGPNLDAARKEALSNSFEQHSFSDSICFCGEREDAAISANQYVGRVLSVRIASDKLDVVQNQGKVFESNLGVHFKQTWP